MEVNIKISSMKWKIVGVYINGDMEEKLEKLKEWTENGEQEWETLIGGDWNARTGRRGGWEMEGGEEVRRESTDEVENAVKEKN